MTLSKIVSTVFDIHNHKIERHADDSLTISPATGHRPITLDEGKAVAFWFWLKVGLPTGHPLTIDPNRDQNETVF